MRLSTAKDRDNARSIAVIHTTLDAGVRLLDTSDAYCWDDSEIGHNERLIARALNSWSGDRSAIEVATKGGIKRPKGAWVNDAKAKSLRSACEASRRALGVDAIDTYQLHAVDPKTPFETSVRALAALQTEGKVKRIGLCNVTVEQIKAARDIADIASVQVSLSAFDDDNLRNGVAEYCRDHGIRLIAYRPLGGVDKVGRLERDPVLREVTARHSASAQEIVLAWLADLGTVPVPGPTQVQHATSVARALDVRLSDGDRRQLDDAFSGRLLRVPRSQRRPTGRTDSDVILVMGMPGAGKSGVAREFIAQGYERLNRDERGGSLSDLVAALDAALAAGGKRFVLDNTYAARKSRNEVIECAWKHGSTVRCIHLTTTIADAQVNAITRLLEINSRLPMPEELRTRGKDDPRFFGPDAQFRYERSVELPDEDEGFESVEVREFSRWSSSGTEARAMIMEFDDVLVRNAKAEGPALLADDVKLADGARESLQRLHADGWLLFAHAWRPHVSRGEVARSSVDAVFARTQELLGVPVTFACCTHDAGPPICWCRKPLPGLILEFALPRHVALERSLLVGRSAADNTLAQRLAIPYSERLP
jgi:aryl-alcohol dehydrogenase-like predicted oxidoreductase